VRNGRVTGHVCNGTDGSTQGVLYSQIGPPVNRGVGRTIHSNVGCIFEVFMGGHVVNLRVCAIEKAGTKDRRGRGNDNINRWGDGG